MRRRNHRHGRGRSRKQSLPTECSRRRLHHHNLRCRPGRDPAARRDQRCLHRSCRWRSWCPREHHRRRWRQSGNRRCPRRPRTRRHSEAVRSQRLNHTDPEEDRRCCSRWCRMTRRLNCRREPRKEAHQRHSHWRLKRWGRSIHRCRSHNRRRRTECSHHPIQTRNMRRRCRRPVHSKPRPDNHRYR